jgi:hypothetical protein
MYDSRDYAARNYDARNCADVGSDVLAAHA